MVTAGMQERTMSELMQRIRRGIYSGRRWLVRRLPGWSTWDSEEWNGGLHRR